MHQYYYYLFVSFISIFNCSLRYLIFQSSAQELEMARISRFGQGLGAPSREDKLKEAAKIHISLGNVQRYCELQVELGQVSVTVSF